MPDTAHTPRALTIAGSDSGGGAGIQADLKAFASCGVHGMSAITAITAQNTLGVSAIHPVPPSIVLAQVRAVLNDIGVDAVKIGMLATAEIVAVVAQVLDELPAGVPVVVDPVMVAESGARLLDEDAENALIAQILPRATVLTPNLHEARALARRTRAESEGEGGVQRGAREGSAERERSAGDEKVARSDGGEGAPSGSGEPAYADDDAYELVRTVLALGPRIVVLTGGHRAQAVDLFLDAEDPDRFVSIPGERHPDGAAHGSGCTHSSVLAAQLALGRTPLQAAFAARELAGAAVAAGLRDVGKGSGPVDVLGLERLRERRSVSE
ncbi:MAG TPA: bifunctional hydroxymethylpyrimidine kinase/phosphomethylpyrimidine kinase [Solirubrobacteraceae bacterium]|nr:bifunctional hydroxymethylpyrimidine kinase/phosphomethylpyrimidine kinase [Solirubrobacteraceae bacterium]